MLLNTAKNYLKLFFTNTPGNEVSIPDIYSAANLKPEDVVKNRTWLGNKTIYLRRLNLIEPIYQKKGNFKVLVAVKLTAEGEKLLGRRPSTSDISESKIPKIALEDVMRVIPELRKNHPEFEIIFDVRLKS